MGEVFWLFFSASLAASVLIVILLAGRGIWKRNFSQSWQYYIWLLVVLRLLIPFSPVLGITGRIAQAGEKSWTAVMAKSEEVKWEAEDVIGNWIPDRVGNGGESGLNGQGNAGEHDADRSDVTGNGNGKESGSFTEADFTGADAGNDAGKNRTSAAQNGIWRAMFDGAIRYGWLFWLMPAAALFGYRVFCYRKYFRMVKACSRPAEDKNLIEACRRTASDMRIRREIPVLFCSAIVSPMRWGL